MSEATQSQTRRVRMFVREHPWFCGSAGAGVVALLVLWGCSGHKSAGPSTIPTDDTVLNQNLLAGVVWVLHHLEDEMPEAAGVAVEHLNQWLAPLRIAFTQGAWRPDPLAAKYVPPELLETLTDFEYTPQEAFHLEEAAWLNYVGQALSRDRPDDLTLAVRMFDWTIRNVQLEDESADCHRASWQAILLGRGEPLTRAWVFMLLARQQKLNVVMLAYPDPRDPNRMRSWIPALALGGELYLFDHNLGLPVPGPGEKGVATLSQVITDESILRQLDAGDRHVYSVKSSDLNGVGAMVEASPYFLSQRMSFLEKYLTGRNSLVLTVEPSLVAAEVQKSPDVAAVTIWDYPYTVMRNGHQVGMMLKRGQPVDATLRAKLDAVELQMEEFSLSAVQHGQSQNLDFLPEMGKDLITRQLFDGADGPRNEQERQLWEQLKQTVRVVPGTLWKARMLQFKGPEFSGDSVASADFSLLKSASHYLQLARTSPEELKLHVAPLLARMQECEQKRAELLTEAAFTPQQEQELARYDYEISRLKLRKNASETRGRTAVYWLGLVAFERGSYDDAIMYFKDMVPEADKEGVWARGTKYNLARSCEAAGLADLPVATDAKRQQKAREKLQAAIDLYEADTSPQRHGNLLRAKWLREKVAAVAPKAAAAPAGEKAAEPAAR
ncbi:MAG: hypothetical protein HYS13_07725 [Planctomycetia bacterium]|nr:hypothetical protein [Planctomycetia bacterium]